MGFIAVCVAVGGVACAPNQPPEASPSQEDAAASSVDPNSAEPAESSKAEAEPSESSSPPRVKAPEFRPGMSVAEAIDAVPQGGDRINVEQEALAAPLLNPELYDPCVKGHEHFRLKVAIWNGRAVGIDIVPAAKNDKLVSCVRELLEKLEWPDRVSSLNTVEFSL